MDSNGAFDSAQLGYRIDRAVAGRAFDDRWLKLVA